MSLIPHHRILIIGAGPSGSTAALALAKKGVKSLLVDQSEFPRDKVCGDALSGKVVLTLKRIDEALINGLSSSENVLPSHGVIFVAPNGKDLKVPFRKDADPANPPGFLSKRWDFDNWLYGNASNENLVECVNNIRLEKFHRENGKWIASDKNNTVQFSADVILAADGAHSRFAKEIGGIQMEEEHYCAGLRAYYSGIKDLNPNGFIELHFIKDFLPGYFWIFPLKGGYANVGVGIRSDIAGKKKINLRQKMLEIIETHPSFKERFIHAKPEGRIDGYGLPLGSKKRKISGEGYLLLGDAASLIDPFTGEGIGNGMISGLKAAEVIHNCIQDNNFSEGSLSVYDELVYKRLWPELNLSKKMQELVRFPWLFNLVVNKANRSKTLREAISCMFEDLDMRGKLKDPRFYFRILTE